MDVDESATAHGADRFAVLPREPVERVRALRNKLHARKLRALRGKPAQRMTGIRHMGHAAGSLVERVRERFILPDGGALRARREIVPRIRLSGLRERTLAKSDAVPRTADRDGLHRLPGRNFRAGL